MCQMFIRLRNQITLHTTNMWYYVQRIIADKNARGATLVDDIPTTTTEITTERTSVDLPELV